MTKEAYPYIFAICVGALLCFPFFTPLAYTILALNLIIIFFFRDPKRTVRAEAHEILSPADGKIREIRIEPKNIYLNDNVQVISIFLSIFDVHINRSPVSGDVLFTQHQPGHFFNVLRKKAFGENENNLIGIQHGHQPILVRQIAGHFAKRIVCYLKQGDAVLQGQKIGIIQFGSGVEIYLPKQAILKVRAGDRVTGGVTILAEVPS